MQRNVLFVALTLALVGAGVVACSGDDNTTPPPPAPVDAGADTTTPHDAGHDVNTGDTNAPDTNLPDTNLPDTNTSETSTDTGTDAPEDTGTDAPITDTGTDGADAACNGVELTVKDVSNWCTLTINGGASFSSGNETVCVSALSTVNLTATANSGFDLGPWHHTTGDLVDAGDNGIDVDAGGKTESDAKIIVGASGKACVWICCPASGFPCPTTDQCP